MIGQSVGRYCDFCDFQNGGCRHLVFSKIRNFNCLSAVEGQYASSCQISSKSVKRLQTHGDLTVYKMAAVRRLGFVKFEIFNAGAVKRPILHQRTKFRKDRSSRYGDIAIFVIFKMAAAAILNFQKFKILQSIRCMGPMCVTTPNFIKIGQTVADICRFYGF